MERREIRARIIEKFPWHRVLITGGAGFIGSHIVDALVKNGCNVHVVDDFSSGKLSNLSGVQKTAGSRLNIRRGDICDSQFIKQELRDIEVVFHEAAIVSVQKSIIEPELTRRVNLEGTQNLLKCASDSGVKKFIFASSAAVYGDSKELPRSESSKPSPISPYGWSKLEGEGHCKDYHQKYDFGIVILRNFNVYGPRSSAKEYSGVINRFAERISQRKSPVIYGDGKNSRDFVYVEDIVQANILAASGSISSGKIYNVGTGIECTIEKLARLESKILLGETVSLPIEYLPPREGDVRQSYADISRIVRELGFLPRYPIELGLNTYLESLKSQLKEMEVRADPGPQ